MVFLNGKVQLLLLLLKVFNGFNSVGGRQCGTHELSASEKEAAEAKLQKYKQNNGGTDRSTVKTVYIDTYWHVIHDGDEGKLTQAKVDESISVLNEDFANSGSNFRFNLIETTFTDNAGWFDEDVGTDEFEMSQALREGNCATANIFSLLLRNSLGYVNYFPFETDDDCQGDYVDDGIFILHTTVPGGSETDYDMGKTLVHEMGHWMGLYHTFEGEDCDGEGDYVSDTPPQAVETSGCPSPAPDTCPGGGDDPMENYMDYSDDECLFEFTAGQVSRMVDQWYEFRSETPEPEVAETCFSAVATALVKGKGLVSMKNVAIGDSVLVPNSVNSSTEKYQEVYAFGHKNGYAKADFFQITTTSSYQETPLEITGSHLIMKQTSHGDVVAVRADSIGVGDLLLGSKGEAESVTQILSVTRQGLYAPLTKDGQMMVNGLQVSSYTALQDENEEKILLWNAVNSSISHHWVSHVAAAPFRSTCLGFLGGIGMELCEQRNEEGQLLFAAEGETFMHWMMQQAMEVQLVAMTLLLCSMMAFYVLEFFFGDFVMIACIMPIVLLLVYALFSTPFICKRGAKRCF